MAIDTAVKRHSAMNFCKRGFGLPIPDGAINSGDRATILTFYSGIAITAMVIATAIKNSWDYMITSLSTLKFGVSNKTNTMRIGQ